MLIRLIISLVFTVSLSYGACDGTSPFDTNTGLYKPKCGAKFLNMREKDYNYTMALSGAFTAFAFGFLIISSILRVKKGHK